MKEPGKERRKLERFDLKMPARIEFIAPSKEEEILNLFTSDVCSGGAFFHTSHPLSEGTPVQVAIVLSLDKLRELKDNSQQALIKVTGEVLRCEPKGIAVCFNSDYEISPCKPSATNEVLQTNTSH